MPETFVTIPPPFAAGFTGIRIEGMEELRAVRPRFRAQLMRELRVAMEQSKTLLLRTIIPLIPEDTGGTLREIVSQTRITQFGGEPSRTPVPLQSMDITLQVGADLPQLPPIEFGRRPGSWPPVSVLESWGVRNLGTAGLGFVLARAQFQRGLPGPNTRSPRHGEHAFQRTFEKTREPIGRYFEQAVDRVVTKV